MTAAAELAADGDGVAFRVLGAPNETVRLTLVAPDVPVVAAAASAHGTTTTANNNNDDDDNNNNTATSNNPTAAAAVASGRVLLVDVVIPESGVARVQCRTGRGPLASSCAVTAASSSAAAVAASA